MASLTSLNISPLADRVVIEPIEEDEKSASGIVIPDTASKERPQKARFWQLGPVSSVMITNALPPK